MVGNTLRVREGEATESKLIVLWKLESGSQVFIISCVYIFIYLKEDIMV